MQEPQTRSASIRLRRKCDRFPENISNLQLLMRKRKKDQKRSKNITDHLFLLICCLFSGQRFNLTPTAQCWDVFGLFINGINTVAAYIMNARGDSMSGSYLFSLRKMGTSRIKK